MGEAARFTKLQKRNPNFVKSINKKELQSIVSRAFQKTSLIKDFVEIESGRFNTTYKLDVDNLDTSILRIAPSPSLEIYIHEHYLLKRELSVYDFLSLISEYVPKVKFADFTKEIIDRDYMILSFIDGQIWDSMQIKLFQQQNIDLWRQLIRISEKINQIENEEFGFPEPYKRATSWKLVLVNILDKMIQDLHKYSLETYGPKELLKLINKDNYYLNGISKAKLIHGDLWPKNVLIKNDINSIRIVGIIDWERAFWGDPRAEWIMLGTRFAKQKANTNMMFRCGLFSADYNEIPIIGKKYICKNIGELFREQVYLGIYLTQRRLESQRYPRNESWIEEEFRSVIINLKKII